MDGDRRAADWRGVYRVDVVVERRDAVLRRFAANLRRHREAADLAQVELAYGVGVSEVTIRRWEKAKHDPPLSVLCALAEYFDVTIDALVAP